MPMKNKMIDTNGALPLANLLGMFLGGFGVVVFFISQSLTVLIPLLFAPTVCGILCAVLYRAQSNATKDQQDIAINPVRLDIM